MHFHLLFDHPLFEEQPVKDVLEPFGFLVHTNTYELPLDESDGEEFTRYKANSTAYIEQLENTAPKGYTEIARFENEAGILIVSVLAKHVFAQLLLCADSTYAGDNSRVSSPFSDVYRERMRQITIEEFSREDDDGYTKGELATAASCYASVAGLAIQKGWPQTERVSTSDWPFKRHWWKPTDPRRDLVKAGALIAAEIERLDRAAAKAAAAGGDA